ncbi:hypothetical protein CK203_078955 [Vitis vinifera]|uniref:RanBP2-type domain-containing protein n=1 Tax=Vitis vinifera TaxID=29760 RepID=A0A438DA42_VITVI|nr:hypothetical protein CK203_078955 [Vitis vinifera]
MPLGGPSRYGPPIPVPGMHYDYSPGNVHGPYGLLTTFPPGGLCNVPKWFDCFVEAGMGYGSGLLSVDMDLAFRDPHGLEEACQMALPLENVVECLVGVRMEHFAIDYWARCLSEGDWVCPKCDNVNFAFRTTCNMKKCGAARPSSGPSRSDSGAPEVAGLVANVKTSTTLSEQFATARVVEMRNQLLMIAEEVETKASKRRISKEKHPARLLHGAFQDGLLPQ